MSSDNTLQTKYRPTKFDEVIGQDDCIASLARTLKEKSSQTFLFVGPSGCGKTTLARICATTVGSQDHTIVEINAAKFTGVDDMRALTDGLQYRPFNGGVKSIILDEVHALSRQGWSSLLKPLEEPRPWVYWFLCTTEMGKVPENVRTRCSRYDIKPVADGLLFDLLTDIVKKEKLSKVSEDVIDLCARQAKGSPRQAIVNLGVCAECKDRKTAAALLQSAIESPIAVDLARALIARQGWGSIQGILARMKDLEGESVRLVIRAYMTNVILGAKNEKQAGAAGEILSAFSTPFPSGDGLSPVVMACLQVCLS